MKPMRTYLTLTGVALGLAGTLATCDNPSETVRHEPTSDAVIVAQDGKGAEVRGLDGVRQVLLKHWSSSRTSHYDWRLLGWFGSRASSVDHSRALSPIAPPELRPRVYPLCHGRPVFLPELRVVPTRHATNSSRRIVL